MRPFLPLALLLAVLATAAAADGPLLIDPVWRGMRPHDRDLTQHYPPEAMRQNLGGAVTLECGLDAGGGVFDCKVIAEDPEGLGFGKSALEVAWMYHMADGDTPPGGGRVRMHLTFRPPPDPVSTTEGYGLVLPLQRGQDPSGQWRREVIYLGLPQARSPSGRVSAWVLTVIDPPAAQPMPLSYAVYPVSIDCGISRTKFGVQQYFDVSGRRLHWTAEEETYYDNEPNELTRRLVELACGKAEFTPSVTGLAGALADAKARFVAEPK